MLENKILLQSIFVEYNEFMKIFLYSYLVSTIEKRLQELHRKLSEIAEIPKILSSTLATVSETFDKLTNSSAPLISPHYKQTENELNSHYQQHQHQHQHDIYENEQKRKLSYDEDVYDYELSDEGELIEPDEEEKFDAKKTFLQLKHYAARQRKSKDVTPESDYASENNYQRNVENDNNQNTDIDWNDNDNDNDNVNVNYTDNDSVDNGGTDDDEEKSCDMYEEFNLTLFKTPLGHVNDHGSDTEDYEENDDDDDDDDNIAGEDSSDEDFLTTTLTWNLRNKPKLQINDSLDLKQSDNEHNVGSNEDIEEDNFKKNNVQQKSPSEERNIWYQKQQIKDNTPEKEQKLDKLERSWPWADREKIIYKQSTCHLVPNKPLGLIEQRIQLLAKRNLLEHLNKSKNPQ